jgi:peptidoglycan hydrolase-like protein with peptidoglycan-binding domain
VTVDGKFGAKTEAAVKAFQLERRLTVDGKVGPKTWAAIVITV